MKGKAQNKDCPVCGNSLDIDTYVPGQAAKEPVDISEGDITFCFNCRTILKMNKALNIVVPDEIEQNEIWNDEDFQNFIGEIDNARKIKPNMN